MKTIWKVAGVIIFIIVVAFAGSIGKIIGKSSVKKYQEGKSDDAIQEIMIETSKLMNRQLPMMVDKEHMPC